MEALAGRERVHYDVGLGADLQQDKVFGHDAASNTPATFNRTKSVGSDLGLPYRSGWVGL